MSKAGKAIAFTTNVAKRSKISFFQISRFYQESKGANDTTFHKHCVEEYHQGRMLEIEEAER